MITRKHLIFAILSTCILTMFLIAIVPIRSQTANQYDPWTDLNNDGGIDGGDLSIVAAKFGTAGDPIDKTELLIDVNNTYTKLLDTISSCNASLIDLQGRVTALESVDLPMNDTISTIQSRIGTLNASLLDVVSRTNSLNGSVFIMNNSVTNLNNSVTDLQNRTTSLEGETVRLQNNVTMLQATIDSLQTNVTILQGNVTSLYSAVTLLQGAVSTLQTNFALMNASLVQLNQTVNSLNSTFTSSINSLQSEIDMLKANYSVTNLNLAPYAIPFNSTYVTTQDSTTETTKFTDIAGMSLRITLNRTSQIIVMLSIDAYDNEPNNYGYGIQLQALNDSTLIQPGPIVLTPYVQDCLGPPYTHKHNVMQMAYTYNFYLQSIPAGTHTIKIQWKVNGGTGYAGDRTLTVIALPS